MDSNALPLSLPYLAPLPLPPPILLLPLVVITVLLLVHNHASIQRVRVPAVGPSGPISSWIGALLYAKNARKLIAEGYEKHGDFAFKTSAMERWEVFICNKDMIKEYWNLDEDVMSANAVIADLFQLEYTVPGAAEGIHKIPVKIIAKGLTWHRQRLAADPYIFADFIEEFQHAFDVEMGPIGDEWQSVTCFDMASKFVTRLAAKALVGKPLSTDKEFLKLCERYGAVVVMSGWFIRKWPKFLRPLVARMCEAPKIAKRLDEKFTGILADRRRDKPTTPNDLSDWMQIWADSTPHEPPYTDSSVSLLLASLVFGGIHTTSLILVHALFDLATRPSYAAPMRAEVATALAATDGVMTKSALDSFTLVDSFVRECQRTNPLDAGALARRATRDFTFKNGLFIPKGTYIFTPNAPTLTDNSNYPHATEFDGFRHHKAKLRGETRTRFTEPSMKNLQFGDGRHLCPGRFMAGDTIKLFVAHIVMHYEVCIKGREGKPSTVRPGNMTFGKVTLPDMGAQLMIRRRKTE